MSSPQNAISAMPVRSPLMLADRMITLAQDADRAGYAKAASRLVRLACKVLDRQPAAGEAPRRRAPRRQPKSGAKFAAGAGAS